MYALYTTIALYISITEIRKARRRSRSGFYFTTLSQVDEVNELKKIYSHLVAAIQSVLAVLHKQTTLDNLLSYVQFQPLDISLWYRLPGIPTVRLSILNLLRNGELPTPLDLYHAYR